MNEPNPYESPNSETSVVESNVQERVRGRSGPFFAIGITIQVLTIGFAWIFGAASALSHNSTDQVGFMQYATAALCIFGIQTIVPMLLALRRRAWIPLGLQILLTAFVSYAVWYG